LADWLDIVLYALRIPKQSELPGTPDTPTSENIPSRHLVNKGRGFDTPALLTLFLA
jgi:hypothetical protein